MLNRRGRQLKNLVYAKVRRRETREASPLRLVRRIRFYRVSPSDSSYYTQKPEARPVVSCNGVLRRSRDTEEAAKDPLDLEALITRKTSRMRLRAGRALPRMAPFPGLDDKNATQDFAIG
jgi:hypothetical protein